MKFTCDKQPLYEALINVSKAVADKASIPSLEGILFKLENNELLLTAYDLEIGIKTKIAVNADGNGVFCFNARLLTEIIKKLEYNEVTINIEENLNTTITAGITEYNIQAMKADEYPELPECNGNDTISLSQAMLKNMISQTIFAVSQSDAKPIFKGELFEIEDNTFNLVALDGYRLAVRTEQVKTDKNYRFVVPAKTLSEIAKLLKDEDDALCTINVSRKHILFEINNYTVISRLLEGEFHNYKGSIPEKSVTEVIIEKRKFISALERASLLINERIKSPVKCLFNNGMLRISCITSIGKLQDEIEIDLSGPMIEIGFDCHYLIDPLKNTPEDKIKLQLNGGNLPMKIVSTKDSNYVYLVLPVRLR